METRRIGSLDVSVVGLGTNNFGMLMEGRGHSLLELAFAWLIAKPNVASVIAGATNASQVASNAAAGKWRLSHEEVSEVDALAVAP